MRLQIGTRNLPDVIQQLARWFPARAAQLAKLEAKCVLGLEVTLAPMKRRHSNEQRGAYWASLHESARHLGYTAREAESLLHPVICAEAFGQAASRQIVCRGQTYNWPVPAETSSKDADGRVRDVETYSALIETLIRFAAEYGYVIEIERNGEAA